MKGKLSKTENGWVIKHKMDSDLIATDGGFIPVYPKQSEYLDTFYENHYDDIHIQPIIWDGKEVEYDWCVIVDHDSGKGKEYVKLKNIIPELKYKDGTPIRSYRSPKIQELLDEINLEEISKEQLEKERNPKYKYFDIDKDNQKKLITEIMNEDAKDGLYNTSSEIEKLASEHYPEYYSIGLGSDKIGFERGYNLGISSKTEISDEEWVGCDGCTETDEYFWKKGFQAGYNRAKPVEISDEEIEIGADKFYPYDELLDDGLKGMIISAKKGAWFDAIKWYREQIKKKK